jgi:hypothetical protein
MDDICVKTTFGECCANRPRQNCRGQISAVIAVRGVPGQVVVLKGNKPLEFRYSRRYRAVAYATDPGTLDDAIAACCPTPHDWRVLVVRPKCSRADGQIHVRA